MFDRSGIARGVGMNVNHNYEMRTDLVLREHFIRTVTRSRVEPDPFAHMYLEGIFPAELYPLVLRNLPPDELYEPLNLRKWVRPDGTSTRDLFFLVRENLAKLPLDGAEFWSHVVGALTDGGLKRAIFGKLAGDLAVRFGVPEDRVPDIECAYEIMLVRDTQEYWIKPHPDGLNKIVTMQFYLPGDESQLERGTSLFMRNRGLLGSVFTEVKRFPFKPNTGYAFAVSDSAKRTSWHGLRKLTGFAGARNSLMLLFQQVGPREYRNAAH